jgi:predicted aspartyl protease
MRKLFSTAGLLFMAFVAHSQAQHLTRFSFTQLTGGIILVNAHIDNAPDTLNLILDTGSGGISLDSATAVRLGLPLVPSNKTMRGIGGVKKLLFANNHALKLPGLVVDSLDFHVNNYKLLTSTYGVDIDGIIGYSFLKRFILSIDYDKQQIDVYTPGSFRYPKGGFFIPVQLRTLPITPLLFKEDENQYKNRFIVDCGAGLCMLLNKKYTEQEKLLAGKRQFLTQAEGAGGKNLMQLSYLEKVEIGKFTFRKVPVYIFDDEHNITNHPENAGLIGNELLRRFNVVINYPDTSLYLVPNTHLQDPFDYAYTGMAFYVIEGNLQITDIVKNSPAEKAGLKIGDIILAVDNTFSRNIQTIKNLIQNAGSRVNLIVQRDNKLMEFNMMVASILDRKG